MHSLFPVRLESLSPLAIPIAEASYSLPETSPIQIPSISYPSFVASSVGLIQVYGFTPREGEQGVPITVHINFRHQICEDAVHVRLVIGSKPIVTNVQEIVIDGCSAWQLDGSIPPFRRRTSESVSVPIRVEAFDQQSKMLDVVTFGKFTYWESGQSARRFSFRLRCLTFRSGFCPRADVYPRLHRRGKARTSFRRARTSNSGESDTARLEFRTPLADICRNWEESEIVAGRRLVYFSSEQRNNTLFVSCSAITPEKLSSHDVVVSCIYREDIDQCFITSVDIIFLLQKLVGEQFTVMEKNRIRRNLEGLRPITVSKHRAGVSEFFQKIMDFPDPKPRNIEKDLKVFPWHCLDQALNKIISKYVRFYSSHSSLLSDAWYVVVEPRS
jgi:hypothetical protein